MMTKYGRKMSICQYFIMSIIILSIIIEPFILIQNRNPKVKNVNYLGEEITFNNATRIPIFAFHRLMPNDDKTTRAPHDEWIQSVDVFEKQMEFLYNNHIKTISMDQLYCWYKGLCVFSPNTAVITFDDGNDEDYFLALPILEKYNLKATSFIVGSRTEEDGRKEYNPKYRKFITNAMIEDVSNNYSNLDFQNHSWNLHRKQNGKGVALSLSEEEINSDFEKMSSFKFSYFAYPYGHYNDTFKEAVKDSDYKLAFTFGPTYNYVTRNSYPYEIPRIKINGESTVDTIKKYFRCD